MSSNSSKLRVEGLLILSFLLSSSLHAQTADGEGPRGQLLGLVQPRHSRDIQGSPWGIQAGSLSAEHLAKAAEIGVKWTRLSASWAEIETEKGIYQWTQAEKAVDAARALGITPFLCLAVSNRLYCQEKQDTDPRVAEVYGSNPLPPTRSPGAMQAWLRFIGAAVERFAGKIRYWEVWNEPNHHAYWGAEPDGAEYGYLLKETARVIKDKDPSAIVLGGAMAGLDPAFMDKFLAGGTAELIDVVSFHNYSRLPEERIYKAAEAWEVIRKYKPSLQLWQGECGYPSHSSTRDYRGTSPWGVVIQAKWLLRQSFTDVFFCRTTLSNYFKLVHQGGRGDRPTRSFLTSIDSVLGYPDRGGSRVKSVGVNEKCLLENPDLDPKPGYLAYQNLCAVFDNRYLPVDSDGTITIRDQGIFYGIGADDDAFPSRPLVAVFSTLDQKRFAAYWLPWYPQELIREGRIALSFGSTKFKSPVLIDLLDGSVYRLTPTQGENGEQLFDNIPLADYPLVIAEESEVALRK